MRGELVRTTIQIVGLHERDVLAKQIAHLSPAFHAAEGKLTAEIAEAIQEILEAQGVGVVVEAEHSCMTLRGVNTLGSTLTTSRLLGVIRDDARSREEFLGMVRAA